MMKPVPPAPYASYTICRQQQFRLGDAGSMRLDQALTYIHLLRPPGKQYTMPYTINSAEGLMCGWPTTPPGNRPEPCQWPS